MKETIRKGQNTSNIENKENNPQEDLSPYDTDKYTSEWLQENTTIRGWLLLLLIVMVISSIRAFIDTCTAFFFIENAIIFIPAIVLIVFAILTIRSFSCRKANALFYARSFLGISAIINFANIVMSSMTEATSGMIQLIVILIWFGFLHMSEVVEEVIPSSFREVKTIDYIITGVGFLSTIILFII